MPSPAKKQKKSTASQPETVASASIADEATVAAGPDALVTKEQINQMLRTLRNIDTIDQVVHAMKALNMHLKDENRWEVAAKMIVELEGVGTIHSAFRDWYEQSEEFTMYAIGSLYGLTYFVKKTKITLVRLGGIKTILSVAKKHKDNYMARSYAVGLLCNISNMDDNETKEEVATDACTDLVLETMKRWPDEICTQKAGCYYFENISTVDNIKAKLRAKGICSMLGNVIDNFIDSNDDKKKDACNKAQDTFDKYRKQ